MRYIHIYRHIGISNKMSYCHTKKQFSVKRTLIFGGMNFIDHLDVKEMSI